MNTENVVIQAKLFTPEEATELIPNQRLGLTGNAATIKRPMVTKKTNRY